MAFRPFTYSRPRANPNVSVSAIGGAIECSRTSGQTPCFIQVSASGITAAGTSYPYIDLDYRWDFGDPAGTEFFTNPVTGDTRANANTQRGAEAVYCYRSAGTYTVTLRVSAWNGSVPIFATFTQAITVTAHNASGGTMYFDSVGGSDSNDGLTSGAPKQTVGALRTFLLTANRQAWLKRGSTFTATGGGERIDVKSGGRIGAYGTASDPKPILTHDETAVTASMIPSGQDMVISDLKIIRNNNTRLIDVTITAASDTNTDLYFDHLDLENESTNFPELIHLQRTVLVTTSRGWGTYGCTFTSPQTPNEGALHATEGGPWSWGFHFGATISGAGSNLTLHHHIYSTIQNHGLFKWISFGSGPGRSFCINTNCDDSTGAVVYADYFLVSECDITGTRLAVDLNSSSNDPAKGLFRNFVIEGNLIHDLAGDGAIQGSCIGSLAIKYNNVWDMTGGSWFVSATNAAPTAVIRMHHNKCYQSAATTQVWVNLNQGTWGNAAHVTDNIFQHQHTDARILALTPAQHTSSIVDRNQYYAPNDSNGEYLFNNTTDQTLLQWQGLGYDANSVAADPGWDDPGNGNFES